MSPLSSWRSLRRRYQLPNIIAAVVATAIVVVVLIAGVKRDYIGSGTVIFLGCFIPAVIFHEVSHGVVALWCGDDTAKRAGRLTLNPIRHIDPVGSIVVPILMVLAGGPAFGWAKPVPVNVGRLRHPRDQAVLVGLAGPATNIVLAGISVVVYHFVVLAVTHFTYAGLVYPGTFPFVSYGVGLRIVIYFGIVNVVLATFNLIPIPPLDGSALLERLLPASVLPQYYRMRFAFILVVLFLVFFDHGFLTHLFDDVENWYLDVASRQW